MTKKQKKVLWRIIATAVLVAVVKLFSIGGVAGTVLYLAAYLIIGYDILRKAFRGIIKGQVFDENFLMAVATVGAIALAVYEKSGDYLEAVAVMLFYQIGELFQSYAVGKSRRSITALMDIRPDYANIEQDGKLVQVDPDDVAVGSIIVVQPGEKIPLDGVVTEGSSTLNTAALTGESLPRDAAVGDEVISGCVNMTGVLKIRTTKAFGESTVSKILELVENSSSHKSRSENFISKFARIYTSAVEAALKNNGYVIGVDVDQNYIGANGVADGTYAYNPFITSAMKGLSEAVNTALSDIEAGDWSEIAASNGNFGLEDGDYIGLPTADDSWNFETFTKDEYETVKEKIKSGEITVDNNSDDATKPTVSEFTTVNYIQ